MFTREALEMKALRPAIFAGPYGDFALALLLAVFLSACSDQSIPADQYSFEHGGLHRSYRLYKPAGLPPKAPLVVVLHGWGQTSDASYAFGFNQLADKYGFAAAYPLGESSQWNAALDKGVDDVDFLSKLAQYLQTEHGLDPDKTFVTGFSMGGYMSYTLACQASDVFKAAAPVAALMDGKVFNDCKPAVPMSILHIHGTMDSLVPIGGNPKDDSPSVAATIDFWVKLNACTPDGTATISKKTTAHYYRNGVGGNEVHYYEMSGIDHLWPGLPVDKKGFIDDSGFNAAEAIWDFFRTR